MTWAVALSQTTPDQEHQTAPFWLSVTFQSWKAEGEAERDVLREMREESWGESLRDKEEKGRRRIKRWTREREVFFLFMAFLGKRKWKDCLNKWGEVEKGFRVNNGGYKGLKKVKKEKRRSHHEGDDCGVRLMVWLLLVKALWFVWGRKEKTNSIHFPLFFYFSYLFQNYLLLILILVPSLLVVG